VLRRAVRTNDDRPAVKALGPLVDEAFDDYLAEIVGLFDESKRIFIEWLVRHYADNHLPAAATKRKRNHDPDEETGAAGETTGSPGPT